MFSGWKKSRAASWMAAQKGIGSAMARASHRDSARPAGRIALKKRYAAGAVAARPAEEKMSRTTGARPELLHRGEHDEDELEVDAEEVGAREAAVEALADRHVPDDLLVVGEVPGRAGHAVKALKVGVEGPGEGDRGRRQGQGWGDPRRQRARAPSRCCRES